MTDVLPSGLEYVSATGAGWTCSEAAGTITCELDAPLANLGSSEIRVVVQVLPGAYPSVTNVADVTTSTPDENEVNDSDDDVVEVPSLVDLEIAKTDRGQLVVGDQAVYELLVTNNGPTPAPGPITVVDSLPTGLAFVSGAGGGFTCAAAVMITCVRDAALGVDESATILVTVDVLPAAFPEVTNTADVTSGSEETDTENNSDTDTAPVEPTIDLEADKQAVSVTADRVAYKVTVTNNGPSDTVAPIRLRDALPDELRLVSAEGSGWSCTTSPRLVVCLYADVLPAGDSASIRLVADIVADPGTKIVNVAVVGGGGGGGVDEDEEEVTVPDTGDTGGNDPNDPNDPNAPNDGALPDTGGPARWVLLVGILLVLAGALVLRRRRG